MGLTVGGLVAAISAASAVGSGVMSYQQSRQQEQSQAAYNKALEQDAIRQYGELDKVEADAIYESHAGSLEAQREYLTAKSQIELQAAATGTYGGSIAASIQDLNTGLGGRMAEITYEREHRLDSVNRQAEQIQASPGLQADRTVQQPAYYKAFSSGLNTYGQVSQIGGAVGNAYNQVKPATPGTRTMTNKTSRKAKTFRG